MDETENPFDTPLAFSEDLLPSVPELNEELLSLGYRLLEPLGQGGGGHVFLAEEIANTARKVAIKFLRPEALATEGFLNRFQTEIDILKKFFHSNIVRVFESDITESGYPFFVMEVLEGRTLASFLAAKERPTLSRIHQIISDIGNGLQHAHSHHVIHRDLKPANVMIEKGDRAVILDFGVASEQNPLISESIATDGRPGTPSYMAPEVKAGAPASAKSDIFSLGVILFELLTGELPHAAYTPPSAYGFAPQWDSIVQKSLRQDPNLRFDAVEEMLAEIKAAKFAESEEQKPPHLARKAKFFWALCGGVSAVAICFLGMWQLHGENLFAPVGNSSSKSFEQRAHELYGGSHLLAAVINLEENSETAHLLEKLSDAKKRIKRSRTVSEFDEVFPLLVEQERLLSAAEIQDYAKACHRRILKALDQSAKSSPQ